MKQFILILVIIIGIILVGCGDENQNNDNNITNELDYNIFVATADYSSFFGNVSVYNNTDFTKRILNVETIYKDNNIKYYKGYLFIINRDEANNIQIINTDNYTTDTQYNVGGSGSNPYDMVFISDTKAYVTLYNDTNILIINPMTGTELGRINISDYADTEDGIPEMCDIVLVGDTVYVTIQKLNRNAWYAPTDNGQILIIDVDNDTIANTISMNGQNPYENSLQYCSATGKLYVVCAGDWNGNSNSQIEEIDPTNNTVKTLIVCGNTWGDTMVVPSGSFSKAITSVSVYNGTTGAFIYGAWNNHYIGLFNPTNGIISDTDILETSSSKNIKEIKYDSKGVLFVLERTTGSEGIFTVNSTGSVSSLYSTGLPPNTIDFSY